MGRWESGRRIGLLLEAAFGAAAGQKKNPGSLAGLRGQSDRVVLLNYFILWFWRARGHGLGMQQQAQLSRREMIWGAGLFNLSNMASHILGLGVSPKSRFVSTPGSRESWNCAYLPEFDAVTVLQGVGFACKQFILTAAIRQGYRIGYQRVTVILASGADRGTWHDCTNPTFRILGRSGVPGLALRLSHGAGRRRVGSAAPRAASGADHRCSIRAGRGFTTPRGQDARRPIRAGIAPGERPSTRGQAAAVLGRSLCAGGGSRRFGPAPRARRSRPADRPARLTPLYLFLSSYASPVTGGSSHRRAFLSPVRGSLG